MSDQSHSTQQNLAERDPADLLASQAELAKQACTAALRILTGRVAHQMRNPLAAVQAACSSLRAELEDPDHQERVDLTLVEVRRMLSLISNEIQAFAKPEETPRDLDLSAESGEIIAILSHARPTAADLSLEVKEQLHCRASRTDLRVALYSLLNFALDISGVTRIDVSICGVEDDADIALALIDADTDTEPAVMRGGRMDSRILSDQLGLLVAERFARDLNGRLTHRVSGDGTQIITLTLPCSHV